MNFSGYSISESRFSFTVKLILDSLGKSNGPDQRLMSSVTFSQHQMGFQRISPSLNPVSDLLIE